MKRNLPTTFIGTVFLTLIAIALGANCIPSCKAQSAQPQDVQQMQQKLEQLEQELSDLKKQMAKIEQEKATAPPAPAQPSPPVVTQTPTVTAAEQKSEPGEEEIPTPPSTIDFYGYVMTDTGNNFGTIDPNWFDVVRPTKLNAFPGEFAPNGTRLRCATDPLRREVNHTHIPWESQNHLRVRIVRHGCRCRPNYLPLATCIWGIGSGRRRSNVESVHGHRRFSQFARVLGPERNGVLPQPASALDTIFKKAIATWS